MLIQPYCRDELKFAYCYRVYIRWRTHCARPIEALARFNHSELERIAGQYDIRLLESAFNATDLLTLVSLKPVESISACASKLKGQVSKWLREAQQMALPAQQLSNGYFACTVGKSTSEAVEQYLSTQSEHHGYDKRARPPVFIQSYELNLEDENRIRTAHSVVAAQFHLVLATSGRRSVFGAQEGGAVANEWRRLQAGWRAALVKVSFLPDHVHLAVRAHPAVCPADLVVELMNSAQSLVFNQFPASAIEAGVERLWQSSAYVGGYGDLASSQISRYIQDWAGAEAASSVSLHETSSWHLEFSEPVL